MLSFHTLGCELDPNHEGRCGGARIMPPVTAVTKDTNPKDAAAAVQGRVPLSLFPDTARVQGAMAFHEGACKYGRYNWRKSGVRASVYVDALERHMTSWWNGEEMDPDSGLPHLAKALACIAVLIDSKTCDKLTDDRPPRAPVADQLAYCRNIVKDISERLKGFDPPQLTIND